MRKLVTVVGVVGIAVLLMVSFPGSAVADGGPVVGPAVWQFLTEGQQVAVITLEDSQTARVNLFISLLDSTGVSHNITFFVPLGYGAANFSVYEQNLLTFDRNTTTDLDEFIYQDFKRRQGVINALFGATLLTNGVWLLPLWLPAIFSGCAAPAPQNVFVTDSSQVSIYGLEANTDLEGLIATTGLDPSVKDTLTRLQGQQIAVVNLKTQPQGTGANPATGEPASERGLRLGWRTSLVEGPDGTVYRYPLGTGSAWYHPIEVTRVYVSAPPGLDFSVRYPRLGADRSGYQGNVQRILAYSEVPAYAIDEASGDFGRVWRAIYTQSNAAEDIVITTRPQSAASKFFIGLRPAGTAGFALLFGLVLAVAFWVLAWRYLMPRLLRGTYHGDAGYLWRTALVYTGINILLMLPGGILYFIWSQTGSYVTLAVLFFLFGTVAAIIFAAGQIHRLSDSPSLAFRAFVLVTLASNGAYLVVAMAYAALTGVI